MADGWICPKCGCVYAPTWYQCQPCNTAPKAADTPPHYELIDAIGIITEICDRRKISRAALCKKIGTMQSTLQRLFSGQTVSLQVTTLNRIIAWDKAQGEAK